MTGIATAVLVLLSFIARFFSDEISLQIFIRGLGYLTVFCFVIAIFVMPTNDTKKAAIAAELAANNQISIEKQTVDKYIITYRSLTDGVVDVERLEVPAEIVQKMRKPPAKSINLEVLSKIWFICALIPSGVLALVFLTHSTIDTISDMRRINNLKRREK